MSDTSFNLSGSRVGGGESIIAPSRHPAFTFSFRQRWGSFTLNSLVSSSINAFKTAGPKQRSSLNKKRSKFWLEESTFRSGLEVLRATMAMKSQVRGTDPSLK